MIRQLAFVGVGLLSGVMSGAMGIGGAIIATPFIRLLGVDAHDAIGTTVPAILPSALTGTLAYMKQGLVDKKAALSTALPAVLAAIAGAFATRAFDGSVLMLLTAVLLLLLAVRSFPTRPKEDHADHARTSSSTAYGVLGAISGFMSGLLGVGGGFIMVPAYLRWFRLPVKVALGTSLAVICITVVPNAVAQGVVGNIRVQETGLLALGVVPGAYLGAKASIAANDRRLQMAIALFMACVAIAYGAFEAAALAT